MFVALSLILGAVYGLADEGREAVQKIDRAKAELSRLKSPDCQTCSTTSVGENDPDWKRCFATICPNGYDRLGRGMELAGVTSTARQDQEFMSAVNDSLRVDIAGQILSDRALRDALKRDIPIKNIAGRRILRLRQVVPLMSQAVVKDGALDIAATRAALSKERPADIDATISMANLSLKIQASVANGPFADDFDFFVQSRSATQVDAAVTEMMSSIQRRAQEIEEQTGLPSGLFTRASRRHAGKPFTEASYEAIKGDSENITAVLSYVSSGALDTPGDSSSLKKSLPPELADKLETRIQALNRLKNFKESADDDLSRRVSLAKATCVAAMDQARYFAPTPSEKKAFREKLPLIKDQFVASLSSRLSAESSATLKTQAQRWLASLPPTYEENRQALIEDLRDNVRASDDGRVDLKNALKNQPGVATAVLALASGDTEDIDPVSSVREICEKKTFAPVRDAAYVNKDQFRVGSMSVKDPTFGAAVVKHEFGHLASTLFSKTRMSIKSKRWYDDVRSCLREAKGSDQTIEEDWRISRPDSAKTVDSAVSFSLILSPRLPLKIRTTSTRRISSGSLTAA